MRGARAFVFAAEEDFGISVVEAQACGTPVIAYGRGGIAGTVLDGETGVFFREQTTDSLHSDGRAVRGDQRLTLNRSVFVNMPKNSA